MAIIRVCDVCRCSLESEDRKSYVNLEYVQYKPQCPIGIPQSVTLCKDCFRKYVNSNLLNKDLVDPISNKTLIQNITRST